MIETFVGAALTAALGAIVWISHLGNRVTALEVQASIFHKWLERIEDKIDQALER